MMTHVAYHENFTAYVSVDKEKPIKLWKSYASGSGWRDFSKDSSTLRARAFFHNRLCLYLYKKYRLFVKILSQM